MRVPSIGLPLDERRIVREGYRIAEHMMRDYQDTGVMASATRLVADLRVMARGLYRTISRN